MHTYQDDTHHKNDHANYSSEWNKVVGEWKSKFRLEDHIGPVDTNIIISTSVEKVSMYWSVHILFWLLRFGLV